MAINRGSFDKLETLKAKYPVVETGDYAEVRELGLTYVYSKNGWIAGSPPAEGIGDMIIAIYDPQGINSDVFNVDNHTDGIINKVFTAIEKIKLLGLTKIHDSLDSINQAGTGITNGHISDQAQSISGLKTFSDAIKAIGNSKFGEAATNFSEFESDGTLKFNGAATVWNDIIIQTSNLRPGNTPPTFAAFLSGIFGFRFDAGAADEVHGAFELPHNYKEGTNLVVHCHWSPTTTNTGNIVFGFEYSHATDSAVFSNASTPTSTPAAAPGVINQLSRKDIVTITGTGFKIGDIIAFRFFRQNGGTDTFTGNAFVHSIGIHYETDTVGSRAITAK